MGLGAACGPGAGAGAGAWWLDAVVDDVVNTKTIETSYILLLSWISAAIDTLCA